MLTRSKTAVTDRAQALKFLQLLTARVARGEATVIVTWAGTRPISVQITDTAPAPDHCGTTLPHAV